MGSVEVGDKIKDLNVDWPERVDPRSEGDNHLRLIKRVIAGQFDGLLNDDSGDTVTPNAAEFNLLKGLAKTYQLDTLFAYDADVMNELYKKIQDNKYLIDLLMYYYCNAHPTEPSTSAFCTTVLAGGVPVKPAYDTIYDLVEVPVPDNT